MTNFSMSSAAHIIDKAVRIVRMWSPWWGKYISQCDFSYTSSSDVSAIKGLSNLIMVVNVDFLKTHNLMEIAVYLEFALQQSMRSMDARAHRYIEDSPSTRHDIIALGQALEINSDIDKKFSSVTPQQWRKIAQEHLDEKYFSSFDVEQPPTLPEGSLLPKDFDFPDGLTAEKYTSLLIEKNRQEEEEFFNNDDSNDNGDGDDSQSRDEHTDGNSNDGSSQHDTVSDKQSESTQNQQSKCAHDKSHPSSHSLNTTSPDDKQHCHASQYSDNVSYDDSINDITPHQEHAVDDNDNDNQQQHSGDAPSDSSYEDMPQGDISDIESQISNDYHDSPDMDRPSQGEHHYGWSESDNNTDNDDMNNDEKRDTRDTGNNTPPSPSPSLNHNDAMSGLEAALANDHDDSPTSSQQDHEAIHKEYKHLMDRLRDTLPESAQHTIDIPTFNNDAELSGLNKEEKSALDKEVAQDIHDYAQSIPQTGGFSTGEDFIAWSQEKLKKSVVPWQKVLRKMTNLYVSRAQMSGVADLSYAKQNPNQQPDMPIMMGFVTYPPEVTVLLDASPSMVNDKSTAMSEFVGLVQKILMAYSQPITMAAADNSIKYVAYSTSPARNIMKNIGKTFQGSSANFGDTVKKVASKGVVFKGRHYPKPDILIIFTDCLFPWPLEESAKLPISYANVIVASTRPFDAVERFLPRWVKKNKNFVYINE